MTMFEPRWTGGAGNPDPRLRSSAADSPASRSLKPASGGDKPTSVGDGLGFSTLYAEYDPDTLSWKTFQLSFVMAELSEQSLPTFIDAGSMRGGQLFELPTLVRHIDANASSSWPTPRSTMAKIRTNPPRPGRCSNVNLEEAVGALGGPIGYLNPRWIEWLMGFPDQWCTTNSTPSETL